MTTLDQPRPRRLSPARGRRAAPRQLPSALARLRPASATGELTPTAAWLRWAALTVSFLAAWLVVFALVLSSLQEHRSQHTLYAKFREQLALGTAPIGRTIGPGAPVALITAPQAHLDGVVVVEGTSPGNLRAGPGHLRDTVLPGQSGVSAIFGRSVTYGAPFASLTHLRAGDPITVTTALGKFTYAVEDVRSAGDPLPPALAPGTGRLTLATSSASGWRGILAPNHTVYVDALLAKPAGAAPAGLPAAVPTDEQPMQGNSAALMPLVFWLQLLLLAAVGVVWAARRWGPWQAWLVGGVVVLAVLWGASNTAAQLLPNLL